MAPPSPFLMPSCVMAARPLTSPKNLKSSNPPKRKLLWNSCGPYERCALRNVRHTTHHQDLPERVTIVRAGHPFEGKSLAVLRAIHRHGRLYLLLILPDGSKSLIPADWTDIAPTVQPLGAIAAEQTATFGSLEALLHARSVVDALLGRLAQPESEEANSTVNKEGVLAAKSESLRPSAQGNLCLGNPGKRTEDSRDRNPRKAHR